MNMKRTASRFWLGIVVLVAVAGLIIAIGGCSASASSDVSFEIVIPKPINRPLNTSNPQNVIITDDGTMVSP